MDTKTLEELEKAVYELAREIAKIKDDHCGFAGLNWFNRFIRSYPCLFKIFKAECEEELKGI
jgi:hypothetical protein